MKDDWEREADRHNRLADMLNRTLELDRWFLHFEIIQLDSQPRMRPLLLWLQSVMDLLPPFQGEDDAPFVPPSETYQVPGVTIKFEFIPCRPGPKHPDSRIVGAGPLIGGLIDSAERLRVRLDEKGGSRYELRDRPFAICVSVHDTLCDLDDIVNALYGGEEVVIRSGEMTRAEDGFFGRSTLAWQGKNRRVSCILAVLRWLPWAPEEATILRLDNPFAEHPFPSDLMHADPSFSEVERNEHGVYFDWTPKLT